MDIYLCKIDLYISLFLFALNQIPRRKNANYEQIYIFNKNANFLYFYIKITSYLNVDINFQLILICSILLIIEMSNNNLIFYYEYYSILKI